MYDYMINRGPSSQVTRPSASCKVKYYKPLGGDWTVKDKRIASRENTNTKALTARSSSHLKTHVAFQELVHSPCGGRFADFFVVCTAYCPNACCTAYCPNPCSVRNNGDTIMISYGSGTYENLHDIWYPKGVRALCIPLSNPNTLHPVLIHLPVLEVLGSRL